MTARARPAGFAVLARTGCVALAVLAVCGTAGCGDDRTEARASTAEPPAAVAGGGSAGAVVAIARGTVEVPGGLLDIVAPQDGIVDTVAVREGDRVEPGQLLLQLAAESQRQELAMAEAELRLARVRQAAQQARQPAAADLARRTAQAAAAGAIDAQVAEESKRSLRDVQAGAAIAAAESAVAEQKVRQARLQASRLTVRAAEAGSVVRLLARPGAHVYAQGGKSLMTLLPARPVRVRAELNETFVARVAVGTRASVRADTDGPVGATSVGSPDSVPAKVVRLSPVFGNSRLDDDALPHGRTRVVECFLEFDRVPPLRVGQAVRVEFHE